MADDPPKAPKSSTDFPGVDFELSTTSRAKSRVQLTPPAQPTPEPSANTKPQTAKTRKPRTATPEPNQRSAETRQHRSRIELDLAEDPRAKPLADRRPSPTPSADASAGPPPAQNELPPPQPLAQAKAPKPRRRSTWILTAVAAAVVLLVVPLVLLMTAGEDDERLVTCKQGTLSVLDGAPSKLEITLYASASNEPITRTADQLERTLLEYAEKSEKLAYYRVDADDPSATARARKFGLGPLVGEDGGSGVSKPVFGLLIEADTKHETLRLHPEVDIGHVDFALSSAIRSLIAKVSGSRVVVGLLTGVDELGLAAGDLEKPTPGSPGPNLHAILEQQFPYYELREVTLGGPTIDELLPVQTLIITQPGRELTGRERRQIDEFMMLGNKSLIVISSAVNVARSDPHMMAHLEHYSLQQLLAGYGLDVKADVVFDPTFAGDYSLSNGARVTAPAVIVARHTVADDEDQPPTFDQSFGPLSPLSELALPFASTIEFDARKQPAATLRAVITSSPHAFSNSQGTTLSPSGSPTKAIGPERRRVLAATVEGRITSAFSAHQAPGRILAIASSQFVTNPFARAAANHDDATLDGLASAYARRHLHSTVLALKGILDWSVASEELLACSAHAKPE